VKTTTKILVVEDNPDIIETISLTFRLSWPEVQVISTSFGEQGLEMVEAETPDCVILDLGLPDISGFEVIRRVRLFSEVPILVLTVRAEEITIVKALGLGASDYVTKPFRQLELLARVKALLRRTKSAEAAPLAVGQMVFDPISFKMTLEGREITLTRTEGLILGQLMRSPDNAVPLSRLAEVV